MVRSEVLDFDTVLVEAGFSAASILTCHPILFVMTLLQIFYNSVKCCYASNKIISIIGADLLLSVDFVCTHSFAIVVCQSCNLLDFGCSAYCL